MFFLDAEHTRWYPNKLLCLSILLQDEEMDQSHTATQSLSITYPCSGPNEVRVKHFNIYRASIGVVFCAFVFIRIDMHHIRIVHHIVNYNLNMNSIFITSYYLEMSKLEFESWRFELLPLGVHIGSQFRMIFWHEITYRSHLKAIQVANNGNIEKTWDVRYQASSVPERQFLWKQGTTFKFALVWNSFRYHVIGPKETKITKYYDMLHQTHSYMYDI